MLIQFPKAHILLSYTEPRPKEAVGRAWHGQPSRLHYNKMMPQSRHLTAIIEREGDGYVALCPELDVASQGDSLEEARANLIEALTLFFETADASEIEQRFHSDLFVTQVEVPVG
jgi:predicted RNase H-like HicB family nuclease